MGRLIFDTRDLDTASKDTLQKIDKALLAAAFKIRDDMRQEYINSSNIYKNRTENYNHLKDGIMIGKLKDNTVKIHSLGNNQKGSDTYKTRFFVGGTIYRTQSTKAGKSIKPYTKGYIKANDAVQKGLADGQETLNTYINNTLNN